MMNTYGRIWIFSGFLLVVTACNQKEFCDQLGQHESNVELNYDWTDGCCIPEEVELCLTEQSGETQFMQTSSRVAYLTFSPGTYQLLAYEKPRNILVEDGIASLISLPDGTFAQPGDFSAGTGCVELGKVGNSHCSIIMKKQFSLLKLAIETSGKDAPSVSQMNGKLSGIVFSRDLRNNCCVQTRGAGAAGFNNGCSVKFNFEQNESLYTGQVKYLGVTDGAKQVVFIDLMYQDGSSQTVEMDVSGNLMNPESETVDVQNPNNISVKLEVAQVKGVFTAKITDWKFEAGGDLEAWEYVE